MEVKVGGLRPVCPQTGLCMVLACRANVFQQHIGAWLWVNPSASQDLPPTYIDTISLLFLLFLDVSSGFKDLSFFEAKK